TDISLCDEEIFQRYNCRWTIETFFRQNKMELNLDKYQIRSSRAIKRYLIITQLAYLYCIFGVCDNYTSFSEGLKIARNNSKEALISWNCDKSQEGFTKQEICSLLKVA
ncbi:transposase, partial [Clostridium tepidiprofundi]